MPAAKLQELSDTERKEHELQWGKFNDAPQGWREITEQEFAQSGFFTYGFRKVEYRQIIDRSQPRLPMVAARMFFLHDGTGFAISQEYWEGRVRYFAFGCSHDFAELSSAACRERGVYHAGRCWHVWECQLCGHIESHDTSD